MLCIIVSRSTPVVKWMLSNVAPHLVWVGKWQPAHPLFRGITFESGQEESRLGVFRWFVGCAKGSSSPAFLKRSQSHFACSPRACSSGPQVKQHSHRGPPGCHRDPTFSLSKRRQFLTGMHRSVSRAEARIARLPSESKRPLELTPEFFAAADPQIDFSGAKILFFGPEKCRREMADLGDERGRFGETPNHELH